jgi:hypothetical protein
MLREAVWSAVEKNTHTVSPESRKSAGWSTAMNRVSTEKTSM